MTMPQTHHLSIGEIDIWLADVSAMTAAQSDVCLCFLDDGELARYHRLRTQASRIQYSAARALLRTTLARYADLTGWDWRFATDAFGRPSVLEPREWRHLQFNLSHTEGLVACAVGVHCRVGLDVENIFRPIELNDLLRYALAAPEAASLEGTSEGVRRSLFFRYWTLKESYMKAVGRGLSIPLDAFWFDLNRRLPAVNFSDRCYDDPERWHFHDYAVGSAHRLAVAISAPSDASISMSDIDVRIHWAPGFPSSPKTSLLD
jgi:4'-phosphopantetheinyl transferase